MNILWLRLIIKEILFDSIPLIFIILLCFFEVIVNLELILLFLFLIHESKICNRYLMTKDIVFWLALKPVFIKNFFIHTSTIIAIHLTISFLIVLGAMTVLFQIELRSFLQLCVLFLSSMILAISVGNFISNSKIAYSYVFLGIPVLRLFLFMSSISFSYLVNHLAKSYFTVFTMPTIIIMCCLALVKSISSQTQFNSKYQFIRLVKRQYEGS